MLGVQDSTPGAKCNCARTDASLLVWQVTRPLPGSSINFAEVSTIEPFVPSTMTRAVYSENGFGGDAKQPDRKRGAESHGSAC